MIPLAVAGGTDSTMKIEGTYQIHAARERVFNALIDPAVLQRCIPGCESLEKTGEDEYAATMKAGVGPVKGTFKGNVHLQDLCPPGHYKLLVSGKGGPGFVKGTAIFDLEQVDASTMIRYSGEMQVGGIIAGVGQRMIEAAAKMMAGKFFGALESELSGEPIISCASRT
ncbi:MAG TPA: carbon monoxide dehydrogenase subunit G, partial [Pyrinomonadaceae bacterium]|nr:carbon monoxide dehydrogenase subunit G [Pyrinomonadaceae bacterium]